MSLVNDMLRDLDERKKGGVVNHQTVAKPKRTTGRWVWIALMMLIMATVLYFVGVELGGKVGERASLLSGLKQDTLADNNVVTNSSVAVEGGVAKSDVAKKVTGNVNALLTEANAGMSEVARPEKAASIITDISLISWTATSPQRGHLTFWIDEVKPFILYGKTTSRLDIAIDESRLMTELPDALPSFISAIEIVPEEGKSRFKLIASGPVEFKPQLKQNPARLVISIIAPDAIPSNEVLSAKQADIKAKPATSEPSANKLAQKQTDMAPLLDPQVKGQWTKSLNTLPTDSSTVRNARRLLGQQRTDDAVNLLTQYIEQAPASLQSQYLLVQLYLATERYSHAAALLETAPNNLSWALLKARSLLQQGQAQTAIQLLEQYPNGRNREDYLGLIASGYQQTGQHGAAVARYLSLLGLSPQEARWWVNLGVSLEHLGQNSKALDAYQTALQIPKIEQSLKQYARQQSQRLQSLQ
jgi:tetratricopeptide (TPR) repeat protein